MDGCPAVSAVVALRRPAVARRYLPSSHTSCRERRNMTFRHFRTFRVLGHDDTRDANFPYHVTGMPVILHYRRCFGSWSSYVCGYRYQGSNNGQFLWFLFIFCLSGSKIHEIHESWILWILDLGSYLVPGTRLFSAGPGFRGNFGICSSYL